MTARPEPETGFALLQPADLQPVSMVLLGKLADVLLGAGAIRKESDLGSYGRVQLIRYFCGSDAYARLVRIRIQVPGQQDWLITPKGSEDEIYLERWVPKGKRLVISLERGVEVAAAALPNPFPPVDVRLEVFG